MLRRIQFGIIFSLSIAALATLLWSLIYAVITSLSFRNMGLLNALTQSDPFAAWKHAIYYWPHAAVQRNAVIAGGAALITTIALVAAPFLIRKPSTFGDARFAQAGELFSTSLNAAEGLVFGWRGRLLIRNDDPAHALIVGPTRSGKGVGFVMPNGLTWRGSLVCLDIKQENFKSFGPARIADGDEVYLFAPGSARSHRYNPLDAVRRGPAMATDLANLAAFLIPEPRGDGAFWASSARNLFSALLGYVLESPVCENNRAIRATLSLLSTGKDIADLLAAIVKTEKAHLKPFIVDQFNQFIPMPEKTRGSVVAHLIDALKPWNNPLIAAVTSASDFNIRELRTKRVSLFIGAPLSDLESYRALVRVLVQQIHDQLMRELPETDDALTVLLLLDEFPALQRMDAIVAKLPVSAGYGIRMAIVVQNLAQIDELYGRATRDTIISNTDLKLFVGINDNATADYVSEMLGTRTVIARTVSGGKQSHPLAPRNITRSEVAAPLIRPDELMRLDKKKAILLIRTERPVLLDKIVSYRDRLFRRLVRRGRDALLSVPKLDPAQETLALRLPEIADHDRPTPSTFAPNPNQGALQFDQIKHRVSRSDGGCHDDEDDRDNRKFDDLAIDHAGDDYQQRKATDYQVEHNEVVADLNDLPVMSEAEEAKIRALIAAASEKSEGIRASELKNTANAFLTLSRRYVNADTAKPR